MQCIDPSLDRKRLMNVQRDIDPKMNASSKVLVLFVIDLMQFD